MSEDTVSPKEASVLLGVSLKTVYGYIKNGILPSVQIGAKYRHRIKKADIDKLME